MKVAIDFGTAVTKIYKIGNGPCLAEATCVTVSRETGERLAFGNEAKRLLGKTAEATDVRFPVFEGEIADEQSAAALLGYFLSKVKRGIGGIDALFCVPCGCRESSREAYYRVARMAGISKVRFIESPYLAAIGQDVPLSDSSPVFTIDVGAGETSIAAFSLDGIIAGLSMSVGGNNIDKHIIDHIALLYNLKIGRLMSEKLKNTVGNLLSDDSTSMIVDGRDVTTGRPRSVSVSSEDILVPLRAYVDKIIEYAELILRKLPAEVSAAMCKSGIYLSGGVSAMTGFADYVSNALQMETHLAADPQTAVVLGGGRVIGNPALLRKLELK